MRMNKKTFEALKFVIEMAKAGVMNGAGAEAVSLSESYLDEMEKEVCE